MKAAALLLLAACSSNQASKPQADHASRLRLCEGASSVTRPLRPGEALGGSDGGVDTVGANGQPVNNELGCTDPQTGK